MSSEESAKLTNQDLAQGVIQACWRAGCREFVVCAGSRNSPLVLELLNLEQNTEELRVWNFFRGKISGVLCPGTVKGHGYPHSGADDFRNGGGRVVTSGDRGSLFRHSNDPDHSRPPPPNIEIVDFHKLLIKRTL